MADFMFTQPFFHGLQHLHGKQLVAYLDCIPQLLYQHLPRAISLQSSLEYIVLSKAQYLNCGQQRLKEMGNKTSHLATQCHKCFHSVCVICVSSAHLLLTFNKPQELIQVNPLANFTVYLCPTGISTEAVEWIDDQHLRSGPSQAELSGVVQTWCS